MRKAHLHFLALAKRLPEGLRFGRRADAIADLLVEIAGNLARSPRAFGFQEADRMVFLAGPVIDDMTPIDVAGAASEK